jgi:hypothetical protein
LGREEAEQELTDLGMVDGRFLVRLKTEKKSSVVYALSYTADVSGRAGLGSLWHALGLRGSEPHAGGSRCRACSTTTF